MSVTEPRAMVGWRNGQLLHVSPPVCRIANRGMHGLYIRILSRIWNGALESRYALHSHLLVLRLCIRRCSVYSRVCHVKPSTCLSLD